MPETSNATNIWQSTSGGTGYFVWTILILLGCAVLLAAITVKMARRRSLESARPLRSPGEEPGFRLTSSAFDDGQQIPNEYSLEGGDLSPPLTWSGVPNGTREFALLCEDPDAPQREPFVHWIAYGLSANTTMLPPGLEAVPHLDLPIRMDQGLNSYGRTGYGGPFPPVGHGWHRYVFTLYALDSELQLKPQATKQEFLRALDRHVLGHTKLVGIFRREASQKAG